MGAQYTLLPEAQGTLCICGAVAGTQVIVDGTGRLGFTAEVCLPAQDFTAQVSMRVLSATADTQSSFKIWAPKNQSDTYEMTLDAWIPATTGRLKLGPFFETTLFSLGGVIVDRTLQPSARVTIQKSPGAVTSVAVIGGGPVSIVSSQAPIVLEDVDFVWQPPSRNISALYSANARIVANAAGLVDGLKFSGHCLYGSGSLWLPGSPWLDTYLRKSGLPPAVNCSGIQFGPTDLLTVTGNLEIAEQLQGRDVKTFRVQRGSVTVRDDGSSSNTTMITSTSVMRDQGSIVFDQGALLTRMITNADVTFGVLKVNFTAPAVPSAPRSRIHVTSTASQPAPQTAGLPELSVSDASCSIEVDSLHLAPSLITSVTQVELQVEVAPAPTRDGSNRGSVLLRKSQAQFNITNQAQFRSVFVQADASTPAVPLRWTYHPLDGSHDVQVELSDIAHTIAVDNRAVQRVRVFSEHTINLVFPTSKLSLLDDGKSVQAEKVSSNEKLEVCTHALRFSKQLRHGAVFKKFCDSNFLRDGCLGSPSVFIRSSTMSFSSADSDLEAIGVPHANVKSDLTPWGGGILALYILASIAAIYSAARVAPRCIGDMGRSQLLLLQILCASATDAPSEVVALLDSLRQVTFIWSSYGPSICWADLGGWITATACMPVFVCIVLAAIFRVKKARAQQDVEDAPEREQTRLSRIIKSFVSSMLEDSEWGFAISAVVYGMLLVCAPPVVAHCSLGKPLRVRVFSLYSCSASLHSLCFTSSPFFVQRSFHGWTFRQAFSIFSRCSCRFCFSRRTCQALQRL